MDYAVALVALTAVAALVRMAYEAAALLVRLRAEDAKHDSEMQQLWDDKNNR